MILTIFLEIVTMQKKDENLYWFEKKFNLQREKHDPYYMGTPNGTNHSVFQLVGMLPLLTILWHNTHNYKYLVLAWLGSVVFWIGLEMWQNWKGIKVGWETHLCWWCIWKWNKSRHHDWIMPALAPFSTLFVAIGTLLYSRDTGQLRKVQRAKFHKTGKG